MFPFHEIKKYNQWGKSLSSLNIFLFKLSFTSNILKKINILEKEYFLKEEERKYDQENEEHELCGNISFKLRKNTMFLKCKAYLVKQAASKIHSCMIYLLNHEHFRMGYVLNILSEREKCN